MSNARIAGRGETDIASRSDDDDQRGGVNAGLGDRCTVEVAPV